MTLPDTATSPANIPTLVVDHDSGGTAASVESTLSLSGFDVTPGVESYPGSGLKVNGSAILYAAGHAEDGRVIAQYLVNLKVSEAPRGMLPRGTIAAVVVSGGYRPQPVGGGSSPSPSAQCAAAAG